MDKLLNELKESLEIICSGNFSKDNVLGFMIKLRQFKPIDPVLVDLCDFFAHSEGRDRGASHKFIRDFIENFINALENNSKITIPEAFFSKNEILTKITQHLKNNGLTSYTYGFIINSNLFIEHLLNSLDSVSYKFINPKINKCYIMKNNDNAFFCFNLKNLSERAVIRRDGTGMTCILIFSCEDAKRKPFDIYMR